MPRPPKIPSSARHPVAKPAKTEVCKDCGGDGLDHTGQYDGPYRGRGLCQTCDGFGCPTPQTPGQRRVKRQRDEAKGLT